MGCVRAMVREGGRERGGWDRGICGDRAGRVERQYEGIHLYSFYSVISKEW